MVSKRRPYFAGVMLLLAGVLPGLAQAVASEVEPGVLWLQGELQPSEINPIAEAQSAAVAKQFARQQGMAELTDDTLSDVQGQAGSLILVDRIGPNELVGANQANTYANNTYYRMGLDAKMDFNLNMSKLQAGCGGVNDLLTGTPACDLDIDYVSFMGINGAGDRPDPAGAASTFKMIRPFLEIAVKNESTAVQREVVGIRVGAQSINGALSIGREYTTATTNLENGGACNPSATTGSGVINCHSGVNSISGFLSLELSAGFKAKGTIATIFPFNLDGCLGRINFGDCSTSDTPFFVDAGGTRIDQLHVAAAKLKVSNIDLGCNIFNFAICLPAQAIANGIISEGYGQLKFNLRGLHYLTLPNTQNFFISFQRERVSWPNYSKTTPPNNVAYDICNPAYGQATPRCSSAYAPAANTGWWLNAPGAKLLNLNPPDRIDVGNVDVGTALSLFGPEGQLIIDNPKLGMSPTDNCYGTAVFC